MKYSARDVTRLGTILGVWAHPDDEVFTSGGLCAQAVANKQRVILITATHGDAGKTADESKWPQKNLTEIREKELSDSLIVLGVIEHHWLNYVDGLLDGIPSDIATSDVEKIVEGTHVDTVISFESKGITGHDDHKAVHVWAKELSKKMNARFLCAVERQEYYDRFGKNMDDKHDVYFNVEMPILVCEKDADVCFKLNEEMQHKKLTAIKAHASQTSGMFASKSSLNALKEMCKCECFIEY